MDAANKNEGDENFEALKRDMESLIENHRGKWVIYKDGKLDSAWHCPEDAAKVAYEKYGNSGFIIHQVPESLYSWHCQEPIVITRLITGF